MKLKENVTHDNIVQFGFKQIDKIDAEGRNDDMASFFEYELLIGHSRRGQQYYLFICENRQLHLYASKPDGAGSPILFEPIFFKIQEIVDI